MRQHAQVLKEALPRASQEGNIPISTMPPPAAKHPAEGVSLAKRSKHLLDLLEILVGILVSHVGGTDVKLEVWSKVLKIVIIWKFCRQEQNKHQMTSRNATNTSYCYRVAQQEPKHRSQRSASPNSHQSKLGDSAKLTQQLNTSSMHKSQEKVISSQYSGKAAGTFCWRRELQGVNANLNSYCRSGNPKALPQ